MRLAQFKNSSCVTARRYVFMGREWELVVKKVLNENIWKELKINNCKIGNVGFEIWVSYLLKIKWYQCPGENTSRSPFKLLTKCLKSYCLILCFLYFMINFHPILLWGDRMVVGFKTTYAIGSYHHQRCELESSSGKVYSIQHYVIKFVSDLWQVDVFLRVH